MATHTDLAARPLAEETAGSLLVQINSPDPEAGGDPAKERTSSPQKERPVLQQFLHNLMVALGAPPV